MSPNEPIPTSTSRDDYSIVEMVDPDKAESGKIENSNSNSSNAEGAEDAAEDAAEEPSFSEWRIQVGGNAASPSNYYYKGSDFRNHATGESILPAEVYMNLFRQVTAFRNRAHQKVSFWHGLITAVPTSILNVSVFSSLNGDNNSTGTYVASMVGIMVAVALIAPAVAIGSIFLNRIYKTLDSQIQALVDESHDEFLESFGVELGYHCPSITTTTTTTAPDISIMNRFVNDDSYVWLRRPRQEEKQAEALEKVATVSSSVATPDEFPPIYLRPLVPGDIHLNEEEYHSSMGIDEQTWRLIQNTHKETLQIIRHFMYRVALVLVLLSVPYVLGIGWPVYWYVSAMCCAFLKVHERYQQAPQQVAETVTRILNSNDEQDEDEDEETNASRTMLKDDATNHPNLVGYSLLWHNSPLEGRSRTSARYQLVRTRTYGPTPFDEKNKTGTNEDEEDTSTMGTNEDEEDSNSTGTQEDEDTSTNMRRSTLRLRL